ncbi:sulfotransferase [Oscillatoriales cyanobacterium LEGE 11467]|uniref:Sulfotransferase n=1 Tax=Zarconia navalis LEGE 11467 TaxID=1828826 RepID=A0A928VZN2_9CYAN|nr:sulfotransferase [Zarconia navalis]MBE9041266.1 sulfotransferase [Zarconia navalis LEGE 11467]
MDLKNYNIADISYLSKVKDTKFSPVFIMADHRSGTTLLYQTLAKTQKLNYIKAYHIIDYHKIVSNFIDRTEEKAIAELENIFQVKGIGAREIDRVPATPHLPEEYGFILKNSGYDSQITPKNLPLFIELCQKIQLISDPEKLLLLKNPWDYPQFSYVKKALPQAKFIFIHRHPLQMMNSKIKAARTLLSQWNEYTALISKQYREIWKKARLRYLYRFYYSQFFELGLRKVFKDTIESTNYFLENISALSPADYINIKFEELCQEPEATIGNILEFLDLTPPETIDCDIQPRPVQLLPEIERNTDRICDRLQPYLTALGYDRSSTGCG